MSASNNAAAATANAAKPKHPRAHGPYLIHSRRLNKFYRAPGEGEDHGHWETEVAKATFYTNQDEPKRTISRICGKLTRHITHVVTVGQAHKLAAQGVADAASAEERAA